MEHDPCYMFYSLFNEMIFTIVYLIESFLAIYFLFTGTLPGNVLYFFYQADQGSYVYRFMGIVLCTYHSK